MIINFITVTILSIQFSVTAIKLSSKNRLNLRKRIQHFLLTFQQEKNTFSSNYMYHSTQKSDG